MDRITRAYAALARCNSVLVRARSEAELLDEVCGILVESAGYALAWVGAFRDADLVAVAAAGTEERRAYARAFSLGPPGSDTARGPIGVALDTRRPVVNRDASQNPSYAPWRERALALGLRSSIAVPMMNDGALLGLLSAYSENADAFDEEEQSLLERLAEDLAYGMVALRTREALSAVESRLHDATAARARFSLVDASPMGFGALDADDRVAYANPVALSFIRLREEELLGKRVHDVFPPTSTLVTDAIKKVRETGCPVDIYLYSELFQRWIEMRLYPLDGGGVAISWVDVTARKKLEDELKRSEEQLRQIADNIDDVVWLSEPDAGRLIYMSPAFERIWGRSRESVYADLKVFFDAIDPRDRARIMRARPDQKKGHWEETYRIVRPDGGVRVIRSVASPVRDASGKVVHIAGVGRDITEHRLLEEQLRQAQKMEAVGHLAGGVAHDFNNLLTVVGGNVALALEDLPAASPVRELLDDVSRAVESASHLTGQLLAFSRKQVIDPKVLNLNDVLAGFEKLLHRTIGEDVKIVSLRDAALGQCRADAGQIEQVIVNLAVNARDAMPDGGTLTIATANTDVDDAFCATHPDAKPGPYVRLSVSDSGMGIAPEIREHIFEPFFTTKGRARGTGLGLAMVYGAVRQHGGFVEVATEVGRGTAFHVHLPRVDAAPDRARATPAAMVHGHEVVMVVEDESILRSLVVRVLTRLGYRVDAFASGEEALAALDKMPAAPTLLLTDVIMPGMNGRALAEKMVARVDGLKVLYMSGYAGDVIGHHRILDQGLHFLPKPFTPEQLSARVRDVLDLE